MKIVVLCHAVPDLANLSVSKSQDRIFEKGKRLLFGPSAVAVEAALRGKLAGGEVIALAWGEDANKDALRKALAMGVDRAAWTAGDPGTAAGALGATRVFSSTVSPLGSEVLAARIAGELGLGADKVELFAPDAFAPRIPNALAAMKAAKKEIETVETPAHERLTRRWATLVAGDAE